MQHSRYKERPSTGQHAAAEKQTTADGSADEDKDYLHCDSGALPGSQAGNMNRVARQAVKASKQALQQPETLLSGRSVSPETVGSCTASYHGSRQTCEFFE